MSRSRMRAGRYGAAVLGTLVLAAAVWLGSADATPDERAQSAPGPIYDGGMWRVDINSIATRSEGGRMVDFDKGNVVGSIQGAVVALIGSALEESYLHTDPSARPAGKDGATTYNVVMSGNADIRITCKPGNASFSGEWVGKGTLSIKFADGNLSGLPGSWLLAAAGTGYAKTAIGLKASGDVFGSEGRETAALAEAIGDDSRNLQGSVALPGFGERVPYRVHVRKGAVRQEISRAKTATVEKRTFNLSLESHIDAELHADDSVVGSSDVSATALATHTAVIRGRGCHDLERDWVSSISVRIVTRGSQTSALLTVLTTEGAAGRAIEDPQDWHGPHAAAFRRTDRKLLYSTGWDLAQKWGVNRKLSAAVPPAAVAPAAPTGRRLGVKKGATAGYAVTARTSALGRLKALRFKVVEADPQTGRVVLETVASFGDGRSDRSRMPVDAFGGLGGLRGILVPAGLKAGERVHGVGRVVRVSGERVTIRYRQGRTRATGVYDRASGWLLELVDGDPRRPHLTLTRR